MHKFKKYYLERLLMRCKICKESHTLADMKSENIECIAKIKDCPIGCGKKLTRYSAEDHYKKCPKALVIEEGDYLVERS